MGEGRSPVQDALPGRALLWPCGTPYCWGLSSSRKGRKTESMTLRGGGQKGAEGTEKLPLSKHVGFPKHTELPKCGCQCYLALFRVGRNLPTG